MQHAKFSIGQIIHHQRFNYRGVIFDVDPVFNGTDEWYKQMAISKPPKNEPWYHVLVDNAEHSTYVAERNLEKDKKKSPISHPMIDFILKIIKKGFTRQSRQIIKNDQIFKYII